MAGHMSLMRPLGVLCRVSSPLFTASEYMKTAYSWWVATSLAYLDGDVEQDANHADTHDQYGEVWMAAIHNLDSALGGDKGGPRDVVRRGG